MVHLGPSRPILSGKKGNRIPYTETHIRPADNLSKLMLPCIKKWENTDEQSRRRWTRTTATRHCNAFPRNIDV